MITLGLPTGFRFNVSYIFGVLVNNNNIKIILFYLI